MKNLTHGPVEFNGIDEKIEALFKNDVHLCKFVNKLNAKEKILGIGLMFSLYGMYKLNRKCKAQRIRMEILEHRMDCFVDNQLDAGKETNECNA